MRNNYEWREKFRKLVIENKKLRRKVKRLESFLEIKPNTITDKVEEFIPAETQTIIPVVADSVAKNKLVDNQSKPEEKIKLFMSLFKGRTDVYATRWENLKKGTSGYSPACGNEWIPGICQKPKIKCSACKNKDYLELTDKAIENHLRGNIVVGIYPMLSDETCWFLAIDFDGNEWQKDIDTLRKICFESEISLAIERSRSGNGGHAWFFFTEPVSAYAARKFGSLLLTYAMKQRSAITFKSYDRLFPNQDTMPKGGLGNLIALPLQKAARENENSVFLDKAFHAHSDQWAFLSSVRRISPAELEKYSKEFGSVNELGILKRDDEETEKPWVPDKHELNKSDFTDSVEIVKSNMLFIPKHGFSEKALNRIKRLAAFKNPEFYKAQAMRLSTFKKPRVIACAEETTGFICLPRGCESDLEDLFSEVKIKRKWIDKRNPGKEINVEFSGNLRNEQLWAIAELLSHETGVLSGTTAFGKTVVAIRLIAERKVNTLILVNKVSLANQWIEKLCEFLTVTKNIEGADNDVQNIFGQIGGGKQTRTGIIDVAIMQSLSRMGEVKEFVKEYGMVIVDECHHIAAFSFELIMRQVNAKFVYGLTATPLRKDGLHPIIFMHCGPVRYRDDAKKQAEKRPFKHYVIPRFTSFRVYQSEESGREEWSIQWLYAALIESEIRNRQIADDVIECFKKSKNCLVLTERVKHVHTLTQLIKESIPDAIAITGRMGVKKTREVIEMFSEAPQDKPLTVVATGRFIGEGFDEPRLDTLFLAMPISWKGTLQQYAGRLHRLSEGKKEALIFDYIDIHIRMFERMYHRRLNGYASIGYKVKGEAFTSMLPREEIVDIIFDKNNFYPVFTNDIQKAKREILIVSPFISKRRTRHIIKNLETCISKNVRIAVMTRPSEDFGNKDLASWHEAIKLIESSGIQIIFRSDIHQKFAIVDQHIIWFGSINLLSYGASEESMMRIESNKIAFELIRSVEITETTYKKQ